jgi:hypothetical protein
MSFLLQIHLQNVEVENAKEKIKRTKRECVYSRVQRFLVENASFIFGLAEDIL